MIPNHAPTDEFTFWLFIAVAAVAAVGLLLTVMRRGPTWPP